MGSPTVSFLKRRQRQVVLACAATVLLAGPVVGQGIDVLRIGSSGATTDKAAQRKENSSLGTLQRFIKDETGLDNKIIRQKNWRELTDKMAKGQLELGVFEGYEFAWAQAKLPGLAPLALAVNVHRYPVAFVVVKRDNQARDFAGLKGKSIYLPPAGPHHLRLFVERQSEISGKKAEAFFSKITSQENVEDALDDVVDGVVDAAAVDQTALEAFKRRKPVRFNRLKELTRSQPLPSAVIAYYGKVPAEALRRRFLEGLLAADRKDQGKMLLALFRVTGFQAIPTDFAKVLARTRKDYPIPVEKMK
jgi:ABC-type phosphate/phosphonate transport system substrate-binding protein